jgi:hypothetical protein
MNDQLSPTCSGIDHTFSRRLFFQGAVAGGMAFGGFGRLFADETARVVSKKQKHVILLFMSGGPSQFETWDPKPGRPTGGPHVSIQTSLPGIHFDEYMPNLARLANRMVTIRSMTSDLGDHTEGAFLAQTSYKPSPIVAPPPHWLSVCAHELPMSSELPAYVNIGKEGDALAVPGAGFLGARYQALYCPGNGQPPQDLPALDSDAIASQQARERLRSLVGQGFRKGRSAHLVDSHEAAFREMTNLLASSEVFDIAKESSKDRDRYGPSRFGRDCLLARRLVEKGVCFVRVQHQNGLAWDKHRRAFDSQRHITTEFDSVVGVLVDDLVDRGLWDDTLLVLMGEFGRTPTIQGQGPPGRNHWTKSWSLSFGGCGLKPGVVVGSTNQDGTDIADRPVTIPDLFCTFYRALGLNPYKEIYFEGRPIPLVEDKKGKPITEVLA